MGTVRTFIGNIKGAPGEPPFIGDNGNWWIGTTDTGVKARGDDGVGIVDIARTSGDGSPGTTDIYTISLTDGSTKDIPIYNAQDGKTAYQYAVDGGYTGTEEEFKAKLAQENYTKSEADEKFLTKETDPTVPAWAKAAEKPTYTAEEVGADERGAAAAALNEAKKYTDDEISELINSAPTTLDTLGEIATAMADNADVVTALHEAVGSKAGAEDLTAHTGNKNNPHGVTAAQLGLKTENFTFTLEDGSTVTKAVYVG